MKKILLATSILAATTGYAAAEVALTGDARMGVVYDGNDVQFSSRARVRFNLSGQTDTGLEFGATFRADHAGGSAGGSWNGRSSDKLGNVWISGAFGKLAMGDVNSAAEEAFGDLSAVGYTGLADFTDITYIVGDEGPEREQGPGALYSYSTGAFEFHLGLSDGNLPSEYTGNVGVEDGADRDVVYSVAAAYNADTFKVGIGYIDAGDNDVNAYGGSQLTVYGSTDVSGFGLKAFYSDYDDYAADNWFGDINDTESALLAGAELDKSYGLSVDYDFGATTVTGFARRDEVTRPAASVLATDYDSFGIGAKYDLGGGASFNAGLVNTDHIGDGETIADVGVKLSF
ncbi:porin [Cereibacter sp. SYSU M97828]|nr:porin [Cereibacter flavus]